MNPDKSQLVGASAEMKAGMAAPPAAAIPGQKRKSVKRAQRYRKEWQRNPLFKDWLRPHPENVYKAYCRVCDKYLVSEVTVIKYHSQGKRHLSKIDALISSGAPGVDPAAYRRGMMKAEEENVHQLCDPDDPENLLLMDPANVSNEGAWPTELHNYIKPASKEGRADAGRRGDDGMHFLSSKSPVKCAHRDDHTVYGENVANRIRKLNDEYLISIARHKIDQALFSVEMLKYKDQSVSVVSSDQAGPEADHMVSSGGVVNNNMEMRSDATVIYTISPSS
ncbi:uncharacterized protein LOC134537455 [Bacillus rossius redtenbacheri]|uniref:uncharacterized protein LOC134537455 n=1 Tax=Bacillus rossius redtenbacheri TaxID=93214 RepID=UPI002FDD67F6